MPSTQTPDVQYQTFVKSVHGVRYQVTDVAKSVEFYTRHLGFTLKHQQLPAFASVALGDTQLLLSGPGASVRGRCRTDAGRNLEVGTAW